MIKQLIIAIGNDEITLSQALTRAKIIAYKIKNETFKHWIKKELEGYEYEDVLLPAYRKIGVINYLTLNSIYGIRTNAVNIPSTVGTLIYDTLNFHKLDSSIPVLESLLKSIEGSIIKLELTPGQAQALYDLTEKREFREALVSGHKETSRFQFTHIIESTKQRLLDTLLELQNEFPDLENDFNMDMQKEEKIQNIVTNNIYGNNNPLVVAAGTNIYQSDFTFNLSSKDIQKLKEWGVKENEIDELKEILNLKATDKASFKDKAMKWLGSVSAAVTGRGLYEHIPMLTAFIHHHLT